MSCTDINKNNNLYKSIVDFIHLKDDDSSVRER